MPAYCHASKLTTLNVLQVTRKLLTSLQPTQQTTRSNQLVQLQSLMQDSQMPPAPQQRLTSHKQQLKTLPASRNQAQLVTNRRQSSKSSQEHSVSSQALQALQSSCSSACT